LIPCADWFGAGLKPEDDCTVDNECIISQPHKTPKPPTLV